MRCVIIEIVQFWRLMWATYDTFNPKKHLILNSQENNYTMIQSIDWIERLLGIYSSYFCVEIPINQNNFISYDTSFHYIVCFDKVIRKDRMSMKSNNIFLIIVFGAFSLMIIRNHLFLSFIFKYIYAYSSCAFQVRNLTIFFREIFCYCGSNFDWFFILFYFFIIIQLLFCDIE